MDSADVSARTAAPAGSPPRVLIVDDERANREVLAIILECEGFVIVAAASGAEALASIAAQVPDLVLLDVMMPEMSGYQVAARMKADPAARNIPLIMITALNDSATRKRALQAGADDFLTKPLDRVKLCLCVKLVLEKFS